MNYKFIIENVVIFFRIQGIEGPRVQVDGSNCELETQILLTDALGYSTPAQLKNYRKIEEEWQRMLKVLITINA